MISAKRTTFDRQQVSFNNDRHSIKVNLTVHISYFENRNYEKNAFVHTILRRLLVERDRPYECYR